MKKYCVVAAVALFSVPAFAQTNTLPWLNQGAAAPTMNNAPKATSTAPLKAPTGNSLPWKSGQAAPQGNAANKLQTPPPMQMQQQTPGNTRELDDRKLNSLASAYYDISSKSKTAVARYTALQKQAKDFHKALDSRAYDVHDVVTDLTKLEGRIAASKKAAIAAQAPDAAKASDAAKKALETVNKVDATEKANAAAK